MNILVELKKEELREIEGGMFGVGRMYFCIVVKVVWDEFWAGFKDSATECKC